MQSRRSALRQFGIPNRTLPDAAPTTVLLHSAEGNPEGEREVQFLGECRYVRQNGFNDVVCRASSHRKQISSKALDFGTCGINTQSF